MSKEVRDVFFLGFAVLAGIFLAGAYSWPLDRSNAVFLACVAMVFLNLSLGLIGRRK